MQERSRRFRSLVAVAAVTAMVVVPSTVWAIDRFTDVPDSNVFHGDISWLATAGVTLGCNPPDNDEFCPADNVTREQMAAFMRRLAENQVVDANTAQTAGDADTVDGLQAADLQGYIVGSNRDSQGATENQIDIDTEGRAIITVAMAESDGRYANVDYGALGQDADATAGTFVIWLQVNDSDCDVALVGDLTQILPGSVTAQSYTAGEYLDLSSSIVLDTSGNVDVTLCALDNTSAGFLWEANLTAVQGSRGDITLDTAGATPDEALQGLFFPTG